MIISLILALYLLGIVGGASAYAFLYVCGSLLIICEVVFGGHGLIALNGLIAFFVAYAIQTGNNSLFSIPIDWSLFFGLAFVEMIVVIISIVVIIRYRKIKAATGRESLPGKKAVIVRWHGQEGAVRVEGETWKAKSDTAIEFAKDAEVTISAVDGLTLKVNA